MCEQLDVVARTNEQAKIFGIDFQSVVFRGSQYRVESMMLRLAHLENYLAPSPSAEQTSRQPAMECLPLVMEPESKLYVDPVAVLDFASLYPSVVCAYNLCYGTCLGKVPEQRDLDAMHVEETEGAPRCRPGGGPGRRPAAETQPATRARVASRFVAGDAARISRNALRRSRRPSSR